MGLCACMPGLSWACSSAGNVCGCSGGTSKKTTEAHVQVRQVQCQREGRAEHRLLLRARQGPAEEVTDAMARIFVWLRYSASRQLTWQRNYNTQPRILGEAQTRLTNAIAAVRLPLLPWAYPPGQGHS